MVDVFLSYSRRDIDFVRRLHGALARRGHDPWVDWEGIPPRAEWLAEIRGAIDAAQAFLFVITPDSVTSEVCADELRHALDGNKRIVPVVRREVDEAPVPDALAKLNWVFAREVDDFDASVAQVVEAVERDLEHVRAHTRLLVRAAEWEREGRDASFTLRGRDLDDAERWLSGAADEEPRPTALQTEYVLESRRAATSRQRRILAGVALAAVVASALGLVAYFENRARERAQRVGEGRSLILRAEALRAVDDRLDDSLRAAIDALALFHDLGVPSPEADLAVRRGMSLTPTVAHEHRFEYRGASFADAAFGPSARRLAFVDRGGTLRLWDTERRRAVEWRPRQGAMAAALAVAVDPTGGHLAVATYDASPDAGDSTVEVFDVAGERRSLRAALPLSGRVEELKLASGGRYVSVRRARARLWDVGERREVALPVSADDVFDLAFDLTGERVAILHLADEPRRKLVTIAALPNADEAAEPWPTDRLAGRVDWTCDPDHLVTTRSDRTEAWVHAADDGRLRSSVELAALGYVGSADHRLVAVRSGTDVVVVRRTDDGGEVARLLHPAEVVAMAFRPDVRALFTLTHEPTVREWTLPGRGAAGSFSVGGDVASLSFSGDSSELSVSTDQERWVVRPAAPDSMAKQAAGDAAPRHPRVTVEDRERVVVTGPDAGPPAPAPTFDDPVWAAAVSDDGAVLAVALGAPTRGGVDVRWEVWRRDPLRRELTLAGSRSLQRIVGFLMLSPDGGTLATAARDGFTLRDLETKESTALYHAGPRVLAFQPGGKLVATAGADDVVRVWRRTDGEELARIEVDRPADALAISPDGRWLATAHGPTVHLWHPRPPELLRQARALLASYDAGSAGS